MARRQNPQVIQTGTFRPHEKLTLTIKGKSTKLTVRFPSGEAVTFNTVIGADIEIQCGAMPPTIDLDDPDAELGGDERFPGSQRP